MVYLDYFEFPNADKEIDFIWDFQNKKKRFDSVYSFYPFKVMSAHRLERIDFESVTILYGGNGSGKSTALNVIAEKLKIKRDSKYNKSNFYPDYLDMCETSDLTDLPQNSRIITSDDVFDYMLDIRNLNEGIDQKREELFKEYIELKYSPAKLTSMDDFERFKNTVKAQSITPTRFVKENLIDNVRGYSNGENAFIYFTEKINENGLYILDEPENSLSAKRQIELVGFIEESMRFFGCQVIISTHSPFLLSMRGAKIYDLDENPVAVKKWTELENVRLYYEFFKSHYNEF